MATIFPDIEPLLVTLIKNGLTASANPVTSSVTVATKKPAASVNPYPARIVTVRADGGPPVERDLTKAELVGVNVFCNTYSDASTLSLLVDSIIRDGAGGAIKLVESQLSPVRIDNEGPQEQRYMTFRLVVKATDI
jgi:hypothetical protein